MAAKSEIPKLSKAQWKSISNVNWSKHANTIRLFLKDDARTFTPKMLKHYGKDNFELKGDTLFLFKREIVTTDERREEILNEQEGKFGGVNKAHERVLRKYINVGKLAFGLPWPPLGQPWAPLGSPLCATCAQLWPQVEI